jgi:hypothetical protein
MERDRDKMTKRRYLLLAVLLFIVGVVAAYEASAFGDMLFAPSVRRLPRVPPVC